MKTIRLLFLTPLNSFVVRQQEGPPDNSEQKNPILNWKIVNPEVMLFGFY
ncbi:hypothetical protein [Aquimarina sp. Aq78]|nr:hypothetical protein [Aquimarina sp. Aq78]